MLNNIGVIIQARTLSTRLPRKIVLEIEEGVAFLDILLERLNSLEKKIPIILATSTLEVDNVLERYSNKYKIGFFRGSERNVLERFINCAEENNFDTIIRVCSDNPFIDSKSILELIENYNGEDYLSFNINGDPSILSHFGFFCEIVSLQALKKIALKNELNCNEHVTNCIYKNSNNFKVRFLNKRINNKSIRCTLDTKEDFLVLRKLYFEIVKENMGINYIDLIKYIESKPELSMSMERTIKENKK